MAQFIIDYPKSEDVETLFLWGEENHFLWAHPKTKWFTKKTLARWVTDPRDDILLVVRSEGVLAGMCFIEMMRDWAYCSGLYVDNDYRKQGVGKMLIEEAKSRLQAKGIEGLDLVVDQENVDAQKFYESCGFTRGFTMQWMYKAFDKEEK